MIREMEAVDVDQEQSQNKIDKRTFEVGETGYKVKVRVEAQAFKPEKRKFEPSNPDEAKEVLPFPNIDAVVYFPGYATKLGISAVNNISQALASEFGVETLAMLPSAEKPTTFKNEAEAYVKYLLETGKKRVVLVGQSQGGPRELYAAKLLQDMQKTDPEIKIAGLALLDPVGLYEQNPAFVTAMTVIDSSVYTAPAAAQVGIASLERDDKGGRFPNVIKALRRARGKLVGKTLAEVTLGSAREQAKGPKNFLVNIAEIAAKNPVAGEIEAPIVLIQGEKDPISSLENTSPAGSVNTIDPLVGSKKPLTLDNMIENSQVRTEDIRRNIFKSAKGVDYLLVRKMGVHNNALLRYDNVARVLRGSLEKLRKEHRYDDLGTAAG